MPLLWGDLFHLHFRKRENNPLKGPGCCVFVWSCLLYNIIHKHFRLRAESRGPARPGKGETAQPGMQDTPPTERSRSSQTELGQILSGAGKAQSLRNSQQQSLRRSTSPTCQLQATVLFSAFLLTLNGTCQGHRPPATGHLGQLHKAPLCHPTVRSCP